MNRQQAQKVRATAISRAHAAVEPLRKALTEAREAASQARASVRHLDAECTRVWNTTYSETLKQETEYNAD